MSKKRKGHGKKDGFKIWKAMLASALVCYAIAVILFIEMLYVINTLSIDVGGSGNLLGDLFGALFGTIGMYSSVAAIYGEYFWIALIAGIAFTVAAIVLSIKKL